MTVGRQWASLGVSPRSSWWSTLRVFVEDSLPDCRYLVSPCTPLCSTKQRFSLWLERWQLGPGALEVGADRRAAWALFAGRALTLSV